MIYRIEYESAKDGLVHTQDIEGDSPEIVQKKLVEKYKAEPSKILSCRRVKDMKGKDSSLNDVVNLLKSKGIDVVKTTGSDANFYVYFKDLDTQKKAEQILKDKGYNTDRMRDTSGLYKVRVQSDLKKSTGYDFTKSEVERAIQNLGYKILRWYSGGGEMVATINLPGKRYSEEWKKAYKELYSKIKQLSKYGKDVYADNEDIVFYQPKFKDSLKQDKIGDADFEFLRKIREYPNNKLTEVLKAIGVYKRFGEKWTWADIDGKLSRPEKEKFLKALMKDSLKQYKIGDAIITAKSPTHALKLYKAIKAKDSKIVYAKDLEEGSIITMKEDNSKWRISQVRKGPFGLTLRINSVGSPVKTREITVQEYYGVQVDSVKDAYNPRLNQIEFKANNSDFDTPEELVAYAKRMVGSLTEEDKRFLEKVIGSVWMMNYKIKDSISDSLSSYDKDLCDYMLENVYEKGMTANDLHKKMMLYSSEYSRLAREKRYDVLDYFEEEIDKGIYDSVKDDDLSELTAEEEQAIEDYREAIANTKDPKLLKVFAHILKEETDHLEELKTKEIEDTVVDGLGKIQIGTRFTFTGTGNKEYIVTNTNAGGKGKDHCFEYAELTPSGDQINHNTMRYSTANKDNRLIKL